MNAWQTNRPKGRLRGGYNPPLANEKSGYYPLINQGKTIMKLEVKKHFRHSIELLIHRSSYTTLKVFFLNGRSYFFVKPCLAFSKRFFSSNKRLFNNYSSSPNGLWVTNSPWGRRPNGLLTQRQWGHNSFTKIQLVGKTISRQNNFS